MHWNSDQALSEYRWKAVLSVNIHRKGHFLKKRPEKGSKFDSNQIKSSPSSNQLKLRTGPLLVAMLH